MNAPARDLLRITRFRHLTPPDLLRPRLPNVFFDPIDTEVGIWATVDLIEPGCTVLDLGSGSGAAALAVARAGAGRVHGVDIAEDSVRWATDHYMAATDGARVSFSVADYSALTTPQLHACCPFETAPSVVTSNPPYVPLATAEKRVSIDGGPDGLRLVRHVVRHAGTFDSDLAITIGSYTTPRAAIALLCASGYRIAGVTLGALPLGDHTVQNLQRVTELAASGEGPLLDVHGVTHYLVMGLSCRRIRGSAEPGPTAEDVLALLHLACTSTTTRLEALDNASLAGMVPLRVVTLSDTIGRHHH